MSKQTHIYIQKSFKTMFLKIVFVVNNSCILFKMVRGFFPIKQCTPHQHKCLLANLDLALH